MTAAATKPSGRWSALWAAGMLAIFVGERMIGAGGGRAVATGGGLVLVVAAIAVRAARAASAAADRRQVERKLLALYALGLLAVVLYFVQSDLPTVLGKGKPLEHDWPRLATVLAALWPAIWVAAAWPIALIEMAYAQIARAPKIEVGRVRDAMYSGFGLAAMLVFAFSLCYVASERDKKVDLAYFRTTRPGEVSRKIVRNLDQPIEVAEFFPEGSEVREEVDNYMQDLARESGQLKVTHYDFDIDPVKAKEYGISTNNVIVFVRGARHDQLGFPKEIESAKNALRTLDKQVQQRLLMMVKPPRTVAFTQGHGERNWERPTSDTDKRPEVKGLRDLLVDQNYDVRYLGAADGLAQEVPKDITVVMVLGPQKPFLPGELSALNRFIDRGGRLLLALDPENHVDFPEVLKPLDLEYHDVMLANDQVFARRTHQDIDRTNLLTITYTSHPSVTTLQRLGVRAPIVLPGAGWINAKRTAGSGVTVDAPIKAHYATFEDKNGNFQADPGEERRAWELAATAVKKDARVFVLADSDALADEALPAVPGNQVLAVDVARWLMGDEAFTGITSTEADVPIAHTRKQDTVWFYGTIFLGPALVLLAGVMVTRGARRKGRRARPPGPTGPAEPQGATS
ncbi:MAG TPA: Gldg family protein [Polyangia bacterium]|nr:Gldg family protein [Polyangia bacterium]